MTTLVKLGASSSGFHTQGLLSEKGQQPSLLSVSSLKQRGWASRAPPISDLLTYKPTNQPQRTNEAPGRNLELQGAQLMVILHWPMLQWENGDQKARDGIQSHTQSWG